MDNKIILRLLTTYCLFLQTVDTSFKNGKDTREMLYDFINDITIVTTKITAKCTCNISGILQKEFCINEPFGAKCFGDDVIVMTSARYGFMGTGRCVQFDFGKTKYNTLDHEYFSIFKLTDYTATSYSCC